MTVLLERAHRGDVQARNELFASLYAELNRLASQKLAREAAFTQLDAPSLVDRALVLIADRTDR